jgi:hypothetical protein
VVSQFAAALFKEILCVMVRNWKVEIGEEETGLRKKSFI